MSMKTTVLALAPKKLLLFLTLVAAMVTGGSVLYRMYLGPSSEASWAADQPLEKMAPEDKVELCGRVLDPDGRPAVGAKLHLVSQFSSALGDGTPRATAGMDGIGRSRLVSLHITGPAIGAMSVLASNRARRSPGCQQAGLVLLTSGSGPLRLGGSGGGCACSADRRDRSGSGYRQTGRRLVGQAEGDRLQTERLQPLPPGELAVWEDIVCWHECLSARSSRTPCPRLPPPSRVYPGRLPAQVRVEFACRHLATSDLALIEIALLAGFAYQSHFTRTFRRLMRMTPGQFRRNFRALNEGNRMLPSDKTGRGPRPRIVHKAAWYGGPSKSDSHPPQKGWFAEMRARTALLRMPLTLLLAHAWQHRRSATRRLPRPRLDARHPVRRD